jgi:hypothetical protein
MTVSSELRQFVIDRDAHYVWNHWGHVTCITAGLSAYECFYWPWLKRQRFICIAPVIDPSNPYPCGGKQEVDHVKDAPRLSKRAPDDEFHLVAMCQNHNTWHPPRKELRWAEREYLRTLRRDAEDLQ